MSFEDLIGDPRATAPILQPHEIEAIFARFGRRVVTFAGFGELGYEDEAAFAGIVHAELNRLDPASSIVNTGTLLTRGYRAGIVGVYPLARARGFCTTGIHPSIALAWARDHALSPDVEHPYFVEDSTWGGFLPGTSTPSGTLSTLLAVSSELIAIGGGEHTAQEMAAFAVRGKPVRFFTADMHHDTTRRWSSKAGVTIPSYAGAAQRSWGDRASR
jgi:hypothetical protein